MADVEIHELITAEELSSSDVIADQRESSGVWLTRKLTFNALGLFLNKVLDYTSDLHTTAKTIIGAINELYQRIHFTDVTGTLTAGNTSIVLSDPAITSACNVEFFVDDAFYGVAPTSYTKDGVNHEITLVFEAQSSNMPVKVRIS